MSQIGAIGYACAAFASGLLAVLVGLVVRHSARAARWLLGAVAVSCAWAALVAYDSLSSSVPAWSLLFAEWLRDGAWLLAVLAVLPAAVPRHFRIIASLVWGAWLLGAVFVHPISVVMYVGGLAMALTVLVALEQIYRNASPAVRQDLKYLTLGVGGLYVYDLFLYSQAMLLGEIDAQSWYARGFANTLLMPFLALGARRLPNTDFKVFVSRHVTFFTTTFLAVGIYLLAMSGAGLAIRELGGSWGEIARIVFFVGAFALLLAGLFSSSVRRHVRVFVSKHFYRNKYDYRVEWLRFIKTLSSLDEADVRRASVQSVAQILDSPGGVLFVRDDSGARFVAAGTWPGAIPDLPATLPLATSEPLIEFMCRRRWIVDLRELARSPALYDGLIVPAWLQQDSRWRLVSPVFRLDSLVGFFVLLDPPPPFELGFEDRDLLNTAGQHVATLLVQHDSDRRIAELSQFEAYNRLTAFVMHDLKNCAAQLSLVAGNAVKHRQKPEFVDDVLATTANASDRITRLIQQLNRVAVDAKERPAVLLADAVSVAVERCRARNPAPQFAQGMQCACKVAADREQLVAAIEHVLRNAQDATAAHGSVLVEVKDAGAHVRITVADDGIGMDAEFVQQRLFRPFDSTKGPHGTGIGAFQTRELARSLGGDVEVDSRPGAGTRFSIILPVMP